MALVLHNFGGAEAGVVSGVLSAAEVDGTAGTTHDATVQRSGAYCYRLGSGLSALIRFRFVETGNTALQGNDLIAVAALRFSDTTPGTAYQFWQLRPAASSNRSVGLRLNTDGTVSIIDATGSVVATSAGAPFTVDTWHFCKLYVTEDNSTGAVQFFVDTSSQVSANSIDTVSVDGAIDEIAFLGSGSGDGDVFVDDWVVWSGAADPSDVPDDLYVLGYWHQTGSNEFGTALDGGTTWSLTADNSQSTAASYDSGGVATQSGGFDCDGTGVFAGPNGDSRIGSGDTLEGCKWFLTASRDSTGTPTHFLAYGNDVDGTALLSIVTESTTRRFAKVSDASDGFVPTKDQIARIGGESRSNHDLDMSTMRVFVLFSSNPGFIPLSVEDDLNNWQDAGFNDDPDGSWIAPYVHKQVTAADDLNAWDDDAAIGQHVHQGVAVADDLNNWADAVADPLAAVHLEISVSDSMNNWDDAFGAVRDERFSHNVVVFVEIKLPSGTEYLSHDTIRHPTRLYEGDLISAGSVERSIPIPAGFPRLSDVTIKIADTKRRWRKLLAQESARAGTITIKLGNADGSESLAYTVFRGEIIAAKFPPGAVELTGSDRIFSKMAEDIPSLVTPENFGAMPEDVNEIFAPINYGHLTSDLTTKLGAVNCPLVDTERNLYLVGRHKHKAIDTVYVWSPGDDEFEVVPPRQSAWSGTAALIRRVFASNAGWTNIEEDITIDGFDYTFTYLEFASPLPDGSLVRADIQGIADGDDVLIENPVLALQDILERWLRLPATSDMINLPKFAEAAAVADALGYVGANSTVQATNWQQMIARLLSSFNIDFFTDRSGLLSCKVSASESSGFPIFDDLDILDNTFADSFPIDVYNQLTYRYQLIPANTEWFTTEIFDNELDQEQMGGKILETDLDLHWVHDSEVAAKVVADIGGYWDLASIGLEFELSAPRVIELFDLADLVGITHFEGVEEVSGEWTGQPFKVTSLRLDLDNLNYRVNAISRQGLPVVGGGPLPPTEMVHYLVPGPFQYGRQAYMSGVFVPQGINNHTRLRAIYTRNWGATWTAVDTAAFATRILSAQVYQRGKNLHVVTQEDSTGRVAYHRFDQATREWSIENEEVVATTELDSTVRSGEPIWHLSVLPMSQYPACDIVARANGEIVVSYMGGVRAEDDGTAKGSDPAGPGFYWFAAQFCRVRSPAGVWGSPIRIGNNWPDTTGVYTASESHARAILGPDESRVYFLYGTLGHDDPSILGTYFYGYNHLAFSSLGPGGGMSHHAKWFNANINGAYFPLAGWLGRVESDATKLYGAIKGGFNGHRGYGFDWTIADLALYATNQLAFLHDDIGRIVTDSEEPTARSQFVLESIGDAERPSMHVILVDGEPVWIYLPWWESTSISQSAPKVRVNAEWVTVGSSGAYNDIGAYAFRHGGKKYYALFMSKANALDHFELWSEDDLPVSMTLAEWQAEFG